MNLRINVRPFSTLLAGLLLLLAGSIPLPALTSFHSFPGGLEGARPQGMALSNNFIYGVTTEGGSNGVGTVFSIGQNGSNLVSLHSFGALSGSPATNAEGAYPKCLILSGNTLFGSAGGGGTNGSGAIFSINTNGSGFTDLYAFTAVSSLINPINSDGYGPNSGLILVGDTLYGTTLQGGTNGQGTIFAVKTNGTGFKVLYAFTPLNPTTGMNNDGAQPGVGLAWSGSILYGTTWYGGNYGDGTLFAVNTDGTGFTNLYNFNYHGNDASAPPNQLTVSVGTLYGSTAVGGTNASGTIFSIGTNGLNFTNLYTFSLASPNFPYTNSDGSGPGPLILSSNILYGSTVGGGAAGNGTLFAIKTKGTGFTTLYTFNATSGALSTNSDGAAPVGNILLWNNTLFGQASSGGPAGQGTLFNFSLATSSPQILILSAPQLSLGNANFLFTLSGPAGSNYVLQTSTNLQNWSAVSTSAIPVGGSISLTNTASGLVQGFYRAHLQ